MGSRVVLEGPSIASWKANTDEVKLAFKKAMARAAKSPFNFEDFMNVQASEATSRDLDGEDSRRLEADSRTAMPEDHERHGLILESELISSNVHGATSSMVVSRLVTSGPRGTDTLLAFLREEVALSASSNGTM